MTLNENFNLPGTLFSVVTVEALTGVTQHYNLKGGLAIIQWVLFRLTLTPNTMCMNKIDVSSHLNTLQYLILLS